MNYSSNIWKMYLFKFFRSLHFVGGVLIPFFLDWGQVSFFQVMIIQSFFVFTVVVMEIPSGAVADYIGRKPTLVIAALATMAAAFIYSSYPNFYVFLVGEFVWAIGGSLMSGADEALIYDTIKVIRQEKRSKKILSNFSSFEVAGIMVSAPIGSAIAHYISLRHTMLFMSIPFIIAALIALTLKEPKHNKKQQNYSKTLWEGVDYFRKHDVLKILAFDNISVSALVWFSVWIYQKLLLYQDLPILYFGFVQAGFSLVQIIFMTNFELLEKIFGSRKSYLFYSALFSGIAFILLSVFDNYIATIILILIIGGFGMSRKVLMQNYMNKFISSKTRATVISTSNMIGRLVLGLLYPVVGLLVEWSTAFTLVLLGTGILIASVVSRVEEAHLID